MRSSFAIGVIVIALGIWKFILPILENKEHSVVIKKVRPMDISYEKMSALRYLNSIRDSMRMNKLSKNNQLNIAAQGHADYLVANNESSHYEIEGHKKFIGVRPINRTYYANYASNSVSENLSTHVYSAEDSINGLFSAIYHRFGFLDVSIDSIGVGATQDVSHTANSAFVYVMANSALERLCNEHSFKGRGKYYYKVCKDETHHVREKAYKKALNENKQSNPKIAIYPYDNQNEIPPVFYDESPDPLPNHEVSGFPISIAFNDYYFNEVSLESFKLYDDKNSEINDVLIMDEDNDPHGHFTNMQFALFPLHRLEYNTQYRVEVVYRTKKIIKSIVWYFTTQKPAEPLHTVNSENSTVHVLKGISHILYFPPINAHDLLKNIQFPLDVDVTFIDHNTLKFTVMNDDLNEFTIKSKEHNVHIILD